MNFGTYLIKLKVSLLLAMMLLAGCRNSRNAAGEKVGEPVEVEISDLSDEASDWADSVAASLNLRQKLSQLLIPAIYSADDYWTLRQAGEYADSCIGGVVLLKGNADGARAVARVMSGAKVPPIISIDAEWGLAMRLADAPRFPAGSDLSHEVSENLMYDYGRELARECRLIGINVVLGPVLDVSEPGSFMFRRSLGDDPERVADLALAYSRGLEDGGVMSVAKHFPGHGSVSADSHRGKPVISRSLHELDSIDLYPFRRWVANGLSAVMVGHLAVPSIDSKMLPSAVSHTVVTDLLRHDLGFKGIVMTDAINMKGAEGHTAVDALIAGADIILAPVSTEKEIDNIERAINSGVIDTTLINEKLHRVLFYKYLLTQYRNSPAGTDSLDTDEAQRIGLKLRGSYPNP
ncbi:MAG: glycosyl hydrolase family 3 [Muribaculaceae bacterium]|nr:glycosyl hydrolase family 3 [Muribaculaceae bacterium]